MANTYFDWCVCIHRFFQSGQLNFFTHADSRSDVWSVYTEITENLGTMVVEADDKNDSGITAKKILPKPVFLLADVPITDIMKEVREITKNGFSDIKNGMSGNDQILKNLGVDIEGYTRSHTQTLDKSIRNVSSDVSSMSRTVTQEVSAVSKGISGISGIIKGVSGSVSAIASGAVNALLLENVVKPMFDTLTSTVNLGRITTQKFFEKQIAIFQPGSTTASISANDSGFIQLMKNLTKSTVDTVNGAVNTITKTFTPYEISTIAAHYDPPFIKLLKYLTNATVSTISNFQKSVSNLFQVATMDSTLSNQDSTFIRLMKFLTNSTIKSVTNFDNSVQRLFNVGSIFSASVPTDAPFVNLMKNLTTSTITAIGNVTKAFTPHEISTISAHYDPPFIKLLKYLTNITVSTISNFQKSVSNLFQVATMDNTLSNQDSTFIRLIKFLTNSTIKSVTNLENSVQRLFNVGSIFSAGVPTDAPFVNLMKNLTRATIEAVKGVINIFTPYDYTSLIPSHYDSPFIKLLKNLFRSIGIPNFSTIETRLADIIKNITKVPALNELIKNGFSDLSKTFASITEPIKNIGVTIMKALFESITKFFIPSDPNFLKNKIKGIQEKFNTKFQVPLGFLSLFKTLFGFQRTPFPKQFTLKLYGKDNHVPLELVSLISDIIRPILTSLLCFTILIECYKRVTGSDEAVLQ